LREEDSLLGRQLDEYRLLTMLGQGGMARVYLALDTRLRRYVTVKMIARPLREDPDYIRRFETEAQAIARLDHPHIVQVYRYGEADGLLYLVMKYVEGVSLASILATHQRERTFMDDDEIMRIVGELGQALDYAHSQNVIHRDVKPSNILIDQQGRVVLTDFGLSLLTDEETQGEVFGTPHYIAPEQVLSSADAVPQSDLYAVGVIVYQMLTNELPFDGRNPTQVAELHVYNPPPSPRSKRPALSPAVAAVVRRLLAKHPAERYASGAALTAALSDALTGATVVETPLPTAPLAGTTTVVEQPRPPVTETAIEYPQAEVASVPPLVHVEPAVAAQPPRRPLSPSCLVLAVGLPLLLLLCGLGFWWLNGGGGSSEDRPTLVIPTAATVIAGVEATPTAAPSATVESASPTIVPTSASTETATIAAAATGTATPTLLPTSTLRPSPTVTPTSSPLYRLLLVTNEEQSLFVVNQSAEPFPVEALLLGSDSEGIAGTEWQISSLDPGDCLTAWSATGNPRPPDVNCEAAGEVIERRGAGRFWRREFGVFYAGEEIATCDPDSRCVVEISR
jgi:hypothetical protein